MSGGQERQGAEGKAARVRLFLIDVDGVLTNGKLYQVPAPDGTMVETKGFDSTDGLGLMWLATNGIQTGFGDEWIKTGGIGEFTGGGVEGLRAIAKAGWRGEDHALNLAGVTNLIKDRETVNAEIPLKGLRWIISHVPDFPPDLANRMDAMGMGVLLGWGPLRTGTNVGLRLLSSLFGLGNLGSAYKNLGEPRRAIQSYEQALQIAQEIGDRRGEGNHLGDRKSVV